jgi:hypothetical protein
MTKVVVTDKALRELVREAMFNKEFSGWSSNEEGPAAVNPVVDQSAPVTDPVNPNFTPQTKTEFGVAVNQLVKNLPDTEMPGLFTTVKTAIDKEEENKEEDDMEKKAAQGGTTQVEEAVRKAIRKELAKMNPRWSKNLREARPKEFGPVVGPLPPVTKIPAGVHGGEYMRKFNKHHGDLKTMLGKDVDAVVPEPEEVPPSEENPEATETPGVSSTDTPEIGKRGAYKSTAIGNMADVNGASFEKIATELGFSVAGAKQAVDKALEKAQWIGQELEEDDREILVLTAMNDYIKYLTKSGELTSADIQLMKDHPSIVRELDGFREFLHNAIRRTRKAGQTLVDPLEDD